MAIFKYRSLFAEVLPRRASKPAPAPAPAPAQHASLRADNFVSVSASSSTSSLESLTQPPAYAQAVGERSRRAVHFYPKPEADQVLSVTIRVRGDSYGEIFTTSATFHAYDGLQNQIQSFLYKNFGKGAVGIATPRGRVITEDWQIYQLAYPGFSTSFCNVVYARDDEKIHSPIIIPAAKLLVEVNKTDLGRTRSKSSVFLYLDPNEAYSTTYIDQTGLSIVLPENKGVQEDLAVGKGYYYKDMRGLPSYDEIIPSVSTFGKACYSASCKCCQGWLGSRRVTPSPRHSQKSVPRWKGIELQDYDGLTLQERRYLLAGKR